jgi:glutathione S-transferase
MNDLRLVIGNYNYSSWSLRPWALMKHLGLPFAEHRLALGTPEFASEVARLSPTARVPVLVHGEVTVWESLAIIEYVNELADGRAWPSDRRRRALARAVSSEMHSGFAALRQAYPMNIRARGRRVAMTADLAAAIARIDSLWRDARAAHGALGPWLFGDYSAADAMFLPVAFRFQSYGTEGLSPESCAYLETLVSDPVIAPWVAAANTERERVAAYESHGQP